MPDYAVNEDQLLGWVDSLSNWGRWGDDDELGTLNNLSPELTKRALALVEDGTTVSCAAPLTFNQAELDVPRPPVHYMVGAGEAYRPGDGPGRDTPGQPRPLHVGWLSVQRATLVIRQDPRRRDGGRYHDRP